MTHPEGLPRQPYTVYGCWRETRERYAEVFPAVSPRAAEDQAQMTAKDFGGTLWVCRVVAGKVPSADGYTAFTDPSDPRNDGIENLDPAVDEIEVCDWTVFGIAAPAGTPDHDIPRAGERYGDTIPATSALAAEDVARSRLSDKGGVLMVCATLADVVRACDTYASFVDPDVIPETT